MAEDNKKATGKPLFENNLVKFGFIALVFFLFAFCCIGYIGFMIFDSLFTPDFLKVIWGNLEGYTSLVTMSLVIGGLAFAMADWLQKEKAEKQEKQKISYQHFETIHDRLTAPEQEEARRWIYINIPVLTEDQSKEEWLTGVQKAINAKPKGWTQDRTPGQIYIKLVLNCFDFVGFVVNEYWEAENKEIQWFSPPIAKVWKRLGPYVDHQREVRNEPDYYQEASLLGEYTIQWREKAGYEDPDIVKDTV